MWNGDRAGYEVYYQREDIKSWGWEVLYGYLNIYFHKIGVSFQTFQVIISFVNLILVFRYIKRVTTYVNLSLIFYAFFIFPLDYVLMRNSLSLALVLNALLVLYNDKKLFFFLLILIASLIHVSSIFFLILLFMPSRKINFFLALILCALLGVLSKYIFSAGLLSDSILNHLNYYLTSNKTTAFNIFTLLLSTLLISYYLASKRKVCRYDIFINNINVLAFVLLFTLFLYSGIFVRIFRLIVFINIIYFINEIDVLNKNNVRNGRPYQVLIGFYLVTYSVYLFYYYIYNTREYSLIPLYSNTFFRLIF